MIELLKASEPEADYLLLHLAADKALPDMQRAFLRAVLRMQDAVVVEAIEEALSRNDFAGAVGAIQWEQFESAYLESVKPLLSDLLRAGAVASVDTIPGRPKLTVLEGGLSRPASGAEPPSGGQLQVSFDMTNPRAVAWVEQHAATLVDEVSTNSQAAIRDILSRSFTDGVPTKAAAREIRQHIGLTARQSAAVSNYAKKQTRIVADAHPSWSATKVAETVEARAGRYAQKQLNRRADNIARTETMTASMQGRYELWQQAMDQGLLNPNRTKVRWIITPDDRLCKNCQQMIGERALIPWGGMFDTPLGALSGPPMHNCCRCAASLVTTRAEL